MGHARAVPAILWLSRQDEQAPCCHRPQALVVARERISEPAAEASRSSNGGSVVEMPALEWQRWSGSTRRGGLPRLLCFPHAGGASSVFYRWSRAIGDLVDVRALCLPGRGRLRRCPRLSSMAELVDAILDGLGDELERGYALAGCSMGATVAAAFSEAAREAGLPGPRLLVVCAARAPIAAAGRRRLCTLSDDELRRFSLMLDSRLSSDESYRRYLEESLPLLRADLEVLESYVPGTEIELSCPISAFGGRDDPLVPPSEIERWAGLTREAFHSRIFPVGHYFFLHEPEPFLGALRSSLRLHMLGSVNR